jgi:hypothetical protein
MNKYKIEDQLTKVFQSSRLYKHYRYVENPKRT